MENKMINTTEKYRAIIAYIPLLFFINLKDKSELVRFHTEQGKVLTIFDIALLLYSLLHTNILESILPLSVYVILSTALNFIYILAAVFTVFGILSVLNGQKRKLPIIGSFAEKAKK